MINRYFKHRHRGVFALLCWLSVAIATISTAVIAKGPQAAPLNAPPDAAEIFFQQIAIEVEGGAVEQFLVGDNLTGYYEGFTGRYRQGDGYRIRQTTLFDGFACWRNGQLLQREHAEKEIIFPFGHQAQHKGVRESLLMHAGRQALSLRIESDEPALLSLQPLWRMDKPFRITQRDGLILVQPESANDDSLFIAIASDQAVQLEQSPAGHHASLGIKSEHLVTRLTSKKDAKRLTLHVAFADNADQAMVTAKALLHGESWNQEIARVHQRLTRSLLWTSDMTFNRALVWAEASAWSFVVEEFGTGIWAGLPWFRDNWGRDTFIALPGTLLTTGHFDKAKVVLDNFAQLQLRKDFQDPNYGRIPNRVAANQPTIYNTVDGTPWMIREALEYIRYSGDRDYAKQILPLVQEYIRGVNQHALDQHGLLTHDDADTWMDARIANQEPWSARGNRAVEIQALWFTTLQAAAELAELQDLHDLANSYRDQARKTQVGFVEKFWNGKTMADRLRADGSRDDKLRPNQLMLISIPFKPFVTESIEARVLKNAVSGLLYPYGIASLDPEHPYFHPRHENAAFHHKDAAYHNGTVWGWNAGFTISALTKFGYQDLAWRLSRNLSEQILNHGTRGSMSELLDALTDEQGRIHPSGTYAQAWSVSEFVRNAYQDYLGFRPNLLQQTLHFVPAIPAGWSFVHAQLPFGKQQALAVHVDQQEGVQRWRFQPLDGEMKIQMDVLDNHAQRIRLQFVLSDAPRLLQWNGATATLDGKPLAGELVMASQRPVIGQLDFLPVTRYQAGKHPATQGQDVLKKIILDGKFQ
ncbi:glycogen debranching protein [Permianibacter aggregans]|nr:glycogen debranching protein [Permianibacter aggregans]